MKRRKIGRKTAKVRKAARRNAPKAAYRRTVAAKDTTVAQLARERDEALHQQAATAEILKLISSSPADTQPVFDAIVRSGLKLFPGAAMFIALPDGDKLRAAAFAATDAVRAKMWRTRWPVPLTRAYMHSAAFLDRKTVDIPDARKPPPELAAGAKNFLLTGYRAVTIVPLMRGRTAIGTLSVVRLAPGKLSDRQNAALKTYAAQAVVAIENTRLLSELRESLEQQTATSEVLKVISSSPGDLEPVFQAMLENAVRICDASFGMLFRNDGGLMNAEAMVGVPPQFAEFWRRGPQRPGPRSAFARTIEKRQIVHIADVKTEPAYVEGEPVFVAAVNLGGFRTLLNVPMLKENEVIGVIAIYRQEVRPFSDKEVELLSNFAAQAVIAIENTRLLNELRQRTDDLSESLEQQTATSAVLKVISSTPGELQPVFDAILKNATRICGAKIGILFRYEGGAYSALAMLGVTPAYAEYLNSGPVRPGPATGLGRVADTKQTIQIVDTQAEHVYAEREPLRVATAELGGARSLLNVPMLKDGILVGAIGIYRQEVRPFTDKQVELVTNFAAQAVIAIENTRLLSELRESLQQQTATSDVLKVISRSTFDLQTVLNTLVESAARLCGAEMANIWRPKDGAYRLTASYGIAARYKEYLENKEFLNTIAIEPGRGTMVGRVLLEKKTVHMHDIQADPDFKLSGLVALGGYRTMLGVPILREGEPIGVFVMVQSEVRPFTDKQIYLATTFADQAAIAIENVRLFDEVQTRTRDLSESLEQQTATSEILEVISNSPTDTQPVFDAIVRSGLNLFPDAVVGISLPDRDLIKLAAMDGADAAGVEALRGRFPMPLSHEFITGTAILERREIDLADAREPPKELTVGAKNLLAGGYRAMTVMPMMRSDETIGALNVVRRNPGPLSDKQRGLLRTFASQAVIAIENTRLFSELSESLQQQTATADVLKVISTSPGELEPVFQAMLENAVRICEAKFGVMYRYENNAFRAIALHGAAPASFVEARQRHPVLPVVPGTALGRLVENKEAVQIADVQAEAAYRDSPAHAIGVDMGGLRTVLSVPMLKEGVLIGAFNLFRQEVRPFAAKQVELVTNFAAQAVIAIENTRLLSELRESLQQQTATADVLTVISSSPGTLDPVFSTMLAKATELCEASYSTLWLHEGDGFRTAAIHGDLPPAWIEQWRSGAIYRPSRPDVLLARATEERRPIQVADMRADPSYLQGDPLPVAGVEIAGIRTLLVVPMIKESELVGAIAIYRKEVLPFTEKQIELVQNFAAQAVIAIENTRLLNELRESLQQQTATSDVLKVISRSTFDLQTVLQTLVESAARLCDADKTVITRQKDGVFYRAEAYGFSREFMEFVRNIPIAAERGSAFGRALLERRAVHIPDVKDDAEYTLLEGQKLGDYRTVLAVPMLREDAVIGVLSLTRSDVRPFTEKQIELASTFADQAAIAIENVRLFDEVQGRTRELAASLEDLRTTQDRLVQTQKLASLGQLTAGIAHEIKNPLNFVNNFSTVSSELVDELQDTLKGLRVEEKMRKQVDELTTMLRGNLDKVVQHGKRADSIVKNMLLHSREGSGEHRLVDINALVEESLNLAYHGARAEKQGFNVAIERALDPATGEADVFPQDITRVLLNLISNGFYATTKRKTQAGDDFEPVLVAATRGLGDRVEIRIRDNGTGIPPDVKEKIFNPFFTTKPAGEGTGLGLSLSHDIVVKQHGGSIEVDTRPGEFTEFRVILPRAGAALAKVE